MTTNVRSFVALSSQCRRRTAYLPIANMENGKEEKNSEILGQYEEVMSTLKVRPRKKVRKQK